ncbi:MAG: hypothetical protein QOC89_884 [Paraburkholderia sp.]|uniref:hypothetical protein n=1 Tax=Paraburkholderia sp. TaxID=1926495 RepID=UPI002AFDDFF4|nr:hypothetical protein [Paraburkholderia sp.]MEA3083187.1 hypothetical protein [Paraburkholderia sp.]
MNFGQKAVRFTNCRRFAFAVQRMPAAQAQVGQRIGEDDRCTLNTVEKVALRVFQFARKKADLLDWPTNRSRAPVKGKKTFQKLPTETDSDFFNSIMPKAAARFAS